MTAQKKLALSALISVVPFVLVGFRNGPPQRRTGAPVDDNGTTCNACHRGNDLNTAPGFVRIEAAPFRASQKQTVRVTVSHPDAQRWGFQLTARLASNPAQKAGTFTFTPGGPIRIRCNSGNFLEANQTCGAELEFASHGGTPESTEGGASGAKTFEVEWTPPEGDVGDVVFYAAGNAANNSGNNQGDRIYNSSLRVQAENTCNLLTNPRVAGIGNAATSRASISSNGLISIYGSNFVVSGTRREADAGVIRDNKYPKELACIAVEIAGQRAPVYYVQQDQINAQMPTITQTGNVPVRLILNPGRPSERAVDAGTISVATHGPAFLTFNGTSVAALHTDYVPAAEPAVVPGGRPLRGGDTVLLYLTGLGNTTPSTVPAGDLSSLTDLHRLTDPITVTIGGTTVPASDISFAGLAPGSISGLYQVNLKLPSTTPAGNVPIMITIGGVTSPTGNTIPVAATP